MSDPKSKVDCFAKKLKVSFIDMSRNRAVAIIGMGCHFPGKSTDSELFWEFLNSKEDGVIEVPEDRWDWRRYTANKQPAEPGRTYLREGGFLQDDIYRFDAAFFGISSREAETLDVQQRLLLEVAHQALEDAGVCYSMQTPQDIGVFMGAFAMDNMVARNSSLGRDALEATDAMGATMSLLANRLSYTFNFQGPSFTLDTACSSSLVAVHQACESIHRGDCSVALAGGVNIMLSPGASIMMSRGGFLSPTCRCHSFDFAADGYVRAEGAGVVILKDYDQAVADGDRIHAVIRGTGVNHDGKTAGAALPNSKAQESLMQSVCREAGIEPSMLDYLEAHGTGTKAGDKAEMESIHNAYNSKQEERQQPLVVGSVKSNFGHAEAAAGVAGLIKSVLVLQHGKVPGQLHFNTPSPDLKLSERGIVIPDSQNTCEEYQFKRAGVNSFGYGGTNAHVIIEAVEPKVPVMSDPTESVSGSPIRIVSLSAHDKLALAALADRSADFLEQLKDDTDCADWAYTQATQRSRLRQGLSLPFSSQEKMIEQLRSFAGEGEISDGVFQGSTGKLGKEIVFVCTGMGPQWWGMGQSLYETSSVFRDTAKRCDAIFKDLAGWSILEQMLADDASSQMSKTEVAQPANAVLQIALAAVLEEAGVVPSAVVGHSVGEVSAAYISGSLSLHDTMRVAYHRSRLQQTLEGTGGMLAVGLNEEEIQAYLGLSEDSQVEIAAINSVSSVTLAGPVGELEALDARLVKEQIFSRILKVKVPYHSAFMDPIRKDLRDSLRGLLPQDSKIPFYSTVTASVLEGKQLHAGYWWSNVRKTVSFQKAFDTLLTEGYGLFLELGPHPVLRRSMQENAQARGQEPDLVSTLVRGENELSRLQRSLGELWHHGVDLPFNQYYPLAKSIRLPFYPFQKERLLRETVQLEQDRLGRDAHVFLQQEIPALVETWMVPLNLNFFAYLDDHVIQDEPLWPGAAFIEAALAINLEKNAGKAVTVSELVFQKILPLNVSTAQQLITSFDVDNSRWSVSSADTSLATKWKSHAGGILHDGMLAEVPSAVDVGQLHEAMESLSVADYYRDLSDTGLDYSQCFQSIKALYRNASTVVVELEIEKTFSPDTDYYQVHPALLDGAFQAFLSFADKMSHGTYIPVAIEAIHFIQPVGRHAFAKIELDELSITKCEGSIHLYNSKGEICLIVKKATFRPLPRRAELMVKDLYVPQLMPLKSTPLPLELNASQAFGVLADDGVWASRIAEAIVAKTKHAYSLNLDLSVETDVSTEFVQWIYVVDDTALDEVAAQTMRFIECIKKAVASQVLQLTVVTRGVYYLDSESKLNLVNATVTSLVSVAANEWPELNIRLIDFQEAFDEPGQLSLLQELSSEMQENEICLVRQKRWQPVWSMVNTDFLECSRHYRPLVPENETARLVPAHNQSLSELSHVAEPNRVPLLNEVEIDVRSVGLNFKDLLKATGRMAPAATEDTFSANTLGLECSGIVCSVGSEVHDLKEGDRVTAFSREGCFGNRIITESVYATKNDDAVSFEDGACVIPWVTAHYGLIVQGKLSAGETVLIHSGAGGVGLAAIQVAHLVGAKVVASASSEAKRRYLLELGVSNVVDSSSLRFEDEVRHCTGGRGVDVVLNALSGKALSASFHLLADGGRFIEIGKRDILENRSLPMAVFNRNISFVSIDLDRILKKDIRLLDGSFEFLRNGLRDGQLQSLPFQSFPASKVGEAFKTLASRERIGRVCLNYDSGEGIDVEEVNQVAVKRHGCYLITGGTQGLGMAVAKEFAKKGAGQLILISRSGEISAEDEAALRKLNPLTEVVCRSVDISKREELVALFNEMEAAGWELRGVVHCALVLNDQFLKDITIETLQTVFNAKVMGAHHLGNILGDKTLDFWVNFSSISTLIGNVGQAAYVAANTYLEQFAQKRRIDGKPCLTVLLGYVSDVGVASRDQNVARYLEKAGMRGMSSAMIARRLLGLSGSQEAVVGFFEVNWEQWSQLSFETANWGRFKELLADDPSRLASSKLIHLREQLFELNVEARLEWMVSRIQIMLSEITFTSKGKVDINTPMSHLGIDSLLVVELMGKFKAELGIGLSNNDLFHDHSIRGLSRLILEKYGLNDD
jgi:acyl transferase domain-containing protein/NADPH:quinone reductase-like Zn-dependent oxidoreductase/short-subunit dehydrogenase/acyl carrier protein